MLSLDITEFPIPSPPPEKETGRCVLHSVLNGMVPGILYIHHSLGAVCIDLVDNCACAPYGHTTSRVCEVKNSKNYTEDKPLD